MRRFAFILAALPAFALALSPIVRSGGPPPRLLRDPDPSALLVNLPMNANGSVIPEDPNTVAHVVWNGSALVDTKGNAWTQHGTVPQIASPTPFVPNKPGAGQPFTDANYYSLGAGTDVLDFPSNFTICVVFMPATVAVSLELFGDAGGLATGGYSIVTTASSLRLSSRTPSAAVVDSLTVSVVRSINVGCVGKSGTTIFSKLNLGTTGSATVNDWAVATTGTATLGRNPFSGGLAFTGTIYEFYATTSAWSEAAVTTIQQRAFGMLGARDVPVTFTRAANTATYEKADGTVWFSPANVMRISDKGGFLIEPARTNAVLQSQNMCSGGAAVGPWGLSAATCNAALFAAPDGTTSAVEVTAPGSGSLFQQVTTASSTVFTGSAWTWVGSGTAPSTVEVRCSGGVPTVCACATNDGSTCTTTTATTDCRATVTATTTPVRVLAQATCSVATTLPNLLLAPSNGTAGGTARFWGGQIEIGNNGTSYVQTGASTNVRNAETATIVNPLVDGPQKWCVSGTWTPANRFWGVTVPTALGFYSIGTEAGANSLRVIESSNVVVSFDLYDPTATLKRYNGAHPAWTNVSQHSISTAVTNGVVTTFIGDGVPMTITPQSTGTGLISAMPTTIRLGARSVGAEFTGYMKDFKVYRNDLCR